MTTNNKLWTATFGVWALGGVGLWFISELCIGNWRAEFAMYVITFWYVATIPWIRWQLSRLIRFRPRHFEYDGPWKAHIETCMQCGWEGPLEQGESEHFSDLMEIWCPNCAQNDGSKLALVSYPLARES